MSIPDNYSQWEAHERDQERRLAKRPVCDYCQEHIQDDFYYEINGENICEYCLDQFFRKETDNEYI